MPGAGNRHQPRVRDGLLRLPGRRVAAVLLLADDDQGRRLDLGEQLGRVALVADTDPDFMRFFFACQYAGLIPVPVPAALQLGGSDAYVRQLRLLLQRTGAPMSRFMDIPRGPSTRRSTQESNRSNMASFSTRQR